MTRLEPIGRFGEGAAAEILLAQSANSSARVMIEVLRSELAHEPNVVRTFIAQVELRRALSHPHLARRVSAGTTRDGRPFVVNEPMRGETLRSWLLMNGPMPPERAARFAANLASAVGYLHAQGLVHKNLTPGTVFVSQETQEPKLFDASLSLLRSGAATRPPPGCTLLEPEYMAPERILGARADARSDLYALGILFYELLSGEAPFNGRRDEIFRQHLGAPVPKLPFDAGQWQGIIAGCLAKEPSNRFQDVDALLQGLASLGGEQTINLRGKRPTPLRNQLPSQEPAGRTSTPSPDLPAEAFGQYKLVRALGAGGMAQVFLARHTVIDKQVALKLLKPAPSRDPSEVKRFVQEAKILQQIRDPHIAEVYDCVEEPQPGGAPRVYTVMELLEGETLYARMQREPLTIREAARVLIQTCEALRATHKRGYVHRDVKPDNIFLTRHDGKPFVKLIDFGIAKPIVQQGPQLTLQGRVVGTPYYMAPERFAGSPFDHRADIYAAGAVLYEVLTGKMPFRGRNLATLSDLVLFEPPPPIGEFTRRGEEIPRPLATLVMRCLAKEPEDRPASALELKRLLAPYAGESVTTYPRPTRKRWLLIGALGGALAAAAAWGTSTFLTRLEQAAEAPALQPMTPRPAPPAPVMREQAPVSPAAAAAPEPEPAAKKKAPARTKAKRTRRGLRY